MLLCYARVSTIDQNLVMQRDALAEADRGENLHGIIVGRGHGSEEIIPGFGDIQSV